MTSSVVGGRRRRPAFAASLAALAFLGATLVAVATGGPAGAAGGSVSISPSTGLAPTGATVRVSGSGWDTSTGIYLMFCSYSGGRPSGAACDSTAQQWISDDARAPISWGEGGSFSVNLTVVAAFGSNDCTYSDVACGVFIRRDHFGGDDDSLDSFHPVEFEVPAAPTDPQDPEVPVEEDDETPGGIDSVNSTAIALSRDTDLADGEAITVTGTGFTSDQGIYVQFCAAPTGTLGTAAGRTATCYPDQDGLHTVWHTPVAADGEFTTPLTVTAGFTAADGTEVDCQVEDCGVFVRRDHNGGGGDFSQDAFAPVTIGDGVVDPGAIRPTLTAKRSTDLEPRGDQVELHGAGFPADVALFVAVCDLNVANFAACDFDHAEEVVPSSNPTRSAGFLLTLPVRALFGETNCTDENTRCGVRTWAVSGDNTAVETTLPITFAGSISAADPSDAGGPDGPGTTGPAGRTGELPRTGIETDGLLAGGLAALAAGAALVFITRRRSVA